jgi:MerR family transcriptional regulator/heat shock protein HspR
MKEREPLYPMGVAAELVGVHPRTLRIYESEGLIKPQRRGGKRYYSEGEIARIKCIKTLLNRGMGIEGVKRLYSLAPCWRVLGCKEKRQECAWYKAYGRWKMRIAFSCEGPEGLNAIVSPHFRRASHFTFVELDGDGEIVNVEVKENPFANIQGPGIVPQFVKEEGADMMVAGGMCTRAAQFLQNIGIKPITGAQGTVMEVLQAILRGEEFEGSLCDHGEHHGHEVCNN